MSGIYIWKYSSSSYILWKEFPFQNSSAICLSPLQFSPTSLLILGSPRDTFQVWRLDDPIIVHPKNQRPYAYISHYGTYMVTFHKGGNTITITNLASQTPPQFIDIDMGIEVVALAGNVLSVLSHGVIIAWRLTEKGVVDGVFGNRRVDCGDAIWTVPVPSYLWVSVVGQIIIIMGSPEEFRRKSFCYAYNAETGEVLKPAQVPECGNTHKYSQWAKANKPHDFHHYKVGSLPRGDWQISHEVLEDGWVKDSEGKHQLWIPFEWRGYLECYGEWFHKTTTLRFDHDEVWTVIIVF